MLDSFSQSVQTFCPQTCPPQRPSQRGQPFLPVWLLPLEPESRTRWDEGILLARPKGRGRSVTAPRLLTMTSR